jgi:hypothetical protein
MNGKTVFTAILLLFVVSSFGYMIFSSSDQQSLDVSEQNALRKTSQDNENDRLAAPAEIAAATGEPQEKLVVYYFHGNKRCRTCMNLENYAHQAISEAFPERIASGSIEWKTVNVDQPANEHFVKDYELYTKSLVLVRMKDGRQVEWKNLEKIWDLVSNQQQYSQYVRENIQEFLNKQA